MVENQAMAFCYILPNLFCNKPMNKANAMARCEAIVAIEKVQHTITFHNIIFCPYIRQVLPL
jgi:hypothetical protein